MLMAVREGEVAPAELTCTPKRNIYAILYKILQQRNAAQKPGYRQHDYEKDLSNELSSTQKKTGVGKKELHGANFNVSQDASTVTQTITEHRDRYVQE